VGFGGCGSQYLPTDFNCQCIILNLVLQLSSVLNLFKTAGLCCCCCQVLCVFCVTYLPYTFLSWSWPTVICLDIIWTTLVLPSAVASYSVHTTRMILSMFRCLEIPCTNTFSKSDFKTMKMYLLHKWVK
jgi:hypothetical protein